MSRQRLRPADAEHLARVEAHADAASYFGLGPDELTFGRRTLELRNWLAHWH
ncbi:MAG: hypothetical protein V2J89_09275 [Halieaceae bacterium]|nr:hypothetical protein [Halieaceae bacterium]